MKRVIRTAPANVIACIALAVALSGTSYAAFVLPANSVGTKQLKNRSIQRLDIGRKTIASLRGQRGPQGPAGLQGAQGIPGVQGSQGIQGSQAPRGFRAFRASRAMSAPHSAAQERAASSVTQARRPSSARRPAQSRSPPPGGFCSSPRRSGTTATLWSLPTVAPAAFASMGRRRLARSSWASVRTH
jgi:hypothetical protein